MFLEKTTRKVLRFNLNSDEELREYNHWLQSPTTRILSRDHVSQSQSTFDRDNGISTNETQYYVFLEVETCSL